jgi:hypothetical protein
MLDTAPSGSNIIFSNTMRGVNHDNSQFYKLNKSQKDIEFRNSEKHRIWLDLVSENQPLNRILVGYAQGATQDRDHMFDAIADNLNFYSLISDTEFVIQGRSLPFDDNDVIPIGFKSNAQGSYHIAIAVLDGIFESNQIVYLRDNLIDITHNLNEQPYSFSAEAGVHNNRFEIVFKPRNALSTNDFIYNSNNISIIELNNDQVKFTIDSNKLSIKNVEIVDLMGRKIYNFKGSNNSESYNLSNLSSTTYIAKITLSNNQVIHKKAIKK